MTLISISPIKSQLDKGQAYVLDNDKNEPVLFKTAINCRSTETAFAEMRQTQKRFGKMGGILGYHIIQSFTPGEVNAEEAHAIGIELAQKYVGGQHEVVIGTHLNQDPLHNHIILNAVSFQDGRKYHMDNHEYERLKALSDSLCCEHGLSVIETPQGQHYAQWQAEKARKPPIRSQIRKAREQGDKVSAKEPIAHFQARKKLDNAPQKQHNHPER